ncbi:hypothetical protein ACFYWY_11000 [Streptomyces sp. NPDC002870]|uniref:hypothetical protein n=1 Tax=Streptomyces sp. NPDC002870 TaxID=3364666 RepID=UPI0036AF7002
MTSGQSDGPEQEFVEALVELQADAPLGDLVEWCAGRGIEVMPMAAGALLTGSGQRFAEAFGERPKDRSQPQTLPVPQALKNTARSVTVMPVPTPGTRDPSPD